jgi:hypothetical protein
MVACFCALEMHCLDSMTRAQLIEDLAEHPDCLPADLQEHVAEQATDRLRLHVLAARLIHALRQQQKCRCQ